MAFLDLPIFSNLTNGQSAASGLPAVSPMDAAKLAEVERLIQLSPALMGAMLTAQGNLAPEINISDNNLANIDMGNGQITLRASDYDNPAAFVATLAHELGHYLDIPGYKAEYGAAGTLGDPAAVAAATANVCHNTEGAAIDFGRQVANEIFNNSNGFDNIGVLNIGNNLDGSRELANQLAQEFLTSQELQSLNLSEAEAIAVRRFGFATWNWYNSPSDQPGSDYFLRCGNIGRQRAGLPLDAYPTPTPGENQPGAEFIDTYENGKPVARARFDGRDIVAVEMHPDGTIENRRADNTGELYDGMGVKTADVSYGDGVVTYNNVDPSSGLPTGSSRTIWDDGNTLSYDAETGVIRTETPVEGGGVMTREISNDGNLITITSPNGSQTIVEFDGDIVRVTDWSGVLNQIAEQTPGELLAEAEYWGEYRLAA